MSTIEKKQQLTAQQLGILQTEMEKNKKSTGVAYALWFFLGSLGVHKFYLKNTVWGIIYIALFVLGWVTLAAGVGVAFFFALGIFLLYDLFAMPRQIKTLYEKEEEKIIDRLLGINTVNAAAKGEA